MGGGGGEGLVFCLFFQPRLHAHLFLHVYFPPFSPTVESILFYFFLSLLFFFFWGGGGGGVRFLLVSDFLGSFFNFII